MPDNKDLVKQEESNTSSLDEMFRAGVHFGYSRSSRHPKMKNFLFGLKNNVEIFNLEKTETKLAEAREFLKNIGKEGRKILFVGTKTEIRGIVGEFAKELQMPYINERWIGGTLTNSKVIKRRIEYMQELKGKRDSGEFDKYTKWEKMQIDKEISDLEYYFGGLETMTNFPSAIVIVDSNKEKIAVKEAKHVSIPVVAIMNSDCNPDDAQYPIPANDNSVSSIKYLLGELAGSYKEGLKEAEKETEVTGNK